MAGSVIGDVVGSAVGGIFGSKGDERAAQQAQQAAERSQMIVNPQPFQGNSLFFNTNARGQASPNFRGNNLISQFGRLNSQAFNQAIKFNPRRFADRMFQAGNRVNDKRDGQAFSSLESKLFNRQGASTGTQRQIADFASDIEDRRSQRFFNAQSAAQQMRNTMLDQSFAASNQLTGFGDRLLENQHQSLQGARALAPFGIDNPAIAQAGQFRAQNTQDFFGNLGNTVGGAVDAGISFFGNRGGGSGGVGNSPAQSSFARPSFGGPGFNPFGSLGF